MTQARAYVATVTQEAQSVAARNARNAEEIKAAQRAHTRAQAKEAAATRRLTQLAVAAYTGEEDIAPVAAPASSPLPAPIGSSQISQQLLAPAIESSDARVLLNAVVGQAKQDVVRDRRLVSTTAKAVTAARDRAEAAAADSARAAAAVNQAQQLLVATLKAAVTPGMSPPALPTSILPAASQPDASRGANPATPAWNGPTVLGPPVLTAPELAGWFASTGHTARTTVPIGELASDYMSAGRQTGVRGDVAFAQSVVETGFFSFPPYGQITIPDNNFAGIGACDSCASGWSFPNALTGVTAQMELLDAYASPSMVSTPLVGPVGVGGCCQTWMSLAGTWATNPGYGLEILSVYKQMLDWALPRRLAAAGLGPPGPGAALPAAPAIGTPAMGAPAAGAPTLAQPPAPTLAPPPAPASPGSG